MEIRNVTKIITFVFFLCFVNIIYSQKTKYLLFDSNKDSIVTVGETKYYKIDKNLFDINRFNKTDTVCQNNLKQIILTTVDRLWKEGKYLHDSIIKAGAQKRRIKVIESYNQIFEEIYILEEISENKYKKTRVWWIDY